MDFRNKEIKEICDKMLTFRSLKNTEFLAQSTWENKFWSNTLHINSNISTSHWLYDWFCNNENNEFCHSRSSIPWTNSRMAGDTLLLTTLLDDELASKVSALGEGVVEFAEPHNLCSETEPKLEPEPDPEPEPGPDPDPEPADDCELPLLLLLWFEVTIWRAGCWLLPPDEAETEADIEPSPAWPRATAIGLGDESGDEVSDDTWGICISCLMCKLAKGDEDPGW